MPLSVPVVPVLFPDDFDVELFFAAFFEDFAFFALFVSDVEPVALVSPAAVEPEPVIPVSLAEPDEPLPVVDFDDFAAFLCLWCFFVPVVLEVEPEVSVPAVLPEPVIPVSLDEPEPWDPIVLPDVEPESGDPIVLPEPEPEPFMLLPEFC